jgi:hypothetical protein
VVIRAVPKTPSFESIIIQVTQLLRHHRRAVKVSKLGNGGMTHRKPNIGEFIMNQNIIAYKPNNDPCYISCISLQICLMLEIQML